MSNLHSFSLLLQKFFNEYLISQRQTSYHTISSYRDCFSLLLRYAQKKFHKAPSKITLSDLNIDFIIGFLDHLENDRKSSIKSRNQRLAVIRSFFHYISFYVPEEIEMIKQVLSIPQKKYEHKIVTFLDQPEIDELVSVIDQNTWYGRRDYALFMLMIQTGLRVSEVTKICYKDINLKQGPYVRCTGKGRKERFTPLTKHMVKVSKKWIAENKFKENEYIFPSRNGGHLSSDTVQYSLKKYINIAGKKCSSLLDKKISPHVLRHTAAVQLLNAGIDIATIALWLGHESIETTNIYLKADLSRKEKLLYSFSPMNVKQGRYIPDDKLLEYLRTL